VSSQYLSPRERRSRLEVLISDHVIEGYEVVDREQTWAEMYKPKRFSLRGCLLGLGVIYLARYLLFEEEDAVRLEVNPQGEANVEHIPIARTGGKRR
jgi:hypothetical protein